MAVWQLAKPHNYRVWQVWQGHGRGWLPNSDFAIKLVDKVNEIIYIDKKRGAGDDYGETF